MTEQLVHDLMQWGAGIVLGWRVLALLTVMIESRVRTEERLEAVTARVAKMEAKAGVAPT